MRYFFIDGTYVPKHCLYGPRPREAILFSNWEWYDINENLFQAQRDRQLAEMYAAKEQAKKDKSYNMTRNWQNTLASIKTQSEQRRIEKRQKIIQGRIDQYNKIIESRKEEKKPILERVKKSLFESQESTRAIVSALLESATITEREKQLELKKAMQEEEARKEAAYAAEIRADADAFREEKRRAALLKWSRKPSKYVAELEQQIKRNRERAEEARSKELREEQDVAKMMEKNEMLRRCREKEKADSMKRTRAGYEKGYHVLELEKTKMLEEEEENEINRMIIKYDKRFKKERKEKEEKMIADSIENRRKMAKVLAEKMTAKQQSDEEQLQRAIREREEAEEKARREKEEERKRANEEMKAWRMDYEAWAERKRAMEREAFKWTVLQNERRREVNKEFEDSLRRAAKDKQARMREAYDAQLAEGKKAAAEAEKEDARFLDKPEEFKQDTLGYCEEALEYVRARGWNEYPVVAAVAKLKKGLLRPEKPETTELDKEAAGVKIHRPNGNGLYCFKC